MTTTFSTRISAFGNNTGIEVPPTHIDALGAGKKPPVKVTVNGYIFQSTVGVMGGKFLISFSKAHREASGLGAGDAVEVTLELESQDREVDIPTELQKALDYENVVDLFRSLTYSARKEYARQITDAKTDETKQKRLSKIITELKNKQA